MNGKLILPLLRPGRRNKSLNVFGILRRVVEYLHQAWPHTVIELRGDSHFGSHEFMAADRMSCSSFRANTFRLFLYGAAYVIAHRLKTRAFAGTEVESFTIDSFIKG